MKKIILMSLMTLSGGLLGNEHPNGQQPANQAPRPQHSTTQRAVSPRRTQHTPNQPPRLHQHRQTTHLSQEDVNSLRRGFIRVQNVIAHEPTAQQIAAQRRTATTIMPRQMRRLGNLNLNTQSRVNDDDTPGAPRAQDDDETNS